MVDNENNLGIVTELKKKFRIYFDGNKFLSSVLAGDIIFKDFDSVLQTGENRGYLVIDSKDSEIYHYENGVYVENGEQKIREIAQWVLGDKATSHHISEVISAVKNYNKIRIKREKLNAYVNLVNLNNCIVNTETLETIPHSKDYYFTMKLNFNYNVDAKCPAILKFLGEIHKQDDIPLIQEIFGYCLYPTYIYHNIFFLIGLGRNGKGTELNLLTSFIGKENTTSNTPTEFEDDPYATADLFGKMANICGEIGNEPLKTTILKKGSGMDIMRGQHKFGHAFDFINIAKFIYSTNEPPPIKDRSTGIWNRLIFIDFPNSFEAGDPRTDVNLIDKLRTQEELSGLFNWAIIGLQRLKKQGRFSFNLTTEETMRWYDRKANPVLAFAQDTLEYCEGEYTPKTTVRRLFVEYCKKHRLQAVSDAWFTKKLCDAVPGCEPDRAMTNDRRLHIYLNIIIKNDDSDQRQPPTSIEPQNPQRTLNVEQSQEDKINCLFTCLEMLDEMTIEKLIKEGFSEIFLNKCLEQGIIRIRPDKNVEVC